MALKSLKAKGLIKYFDGVRYDYQRSAKKKIDAKKHASNLRRRGTQARVVRVGDHYEVFAKTH